MIDETKINPAGKRMLIKIYEMDKTIGGLEVSDTATNSAPVSGEIIKAGKLSIFSVGQHVMFRRYSVDQLTINKPDGENIFYFLEDDDILATIDSSVRESKIDYTQIEEKRKSEKVDN